MLAGERRLAAGLVDQAEGGVGAAELGLRREGLLEQRLGLVDVPSCRSLYPRWKYTWWFAAGTAISWSAS